MSSLRLNHFTEIEGYPYNNETKYLHIDNFNDNQISELSDEILRQVRRILIDKGITKLSFGSPFNKNTNIDFLENFSFLEGLSISLNNFEFAHLYHCRKLKELIIPFEYKGFADFSYFEHLESLDVDMSNDGCETLLRCKNLNFLNLTNYPYQDFSFLNELNELRYLSILQGSCISNLRGIEFLVNLNNLKISGCSSLREITSIVNLINLRNLDFHRCLNIKNLEPVGRLVRLKRFNLDYMGKIPSIDFLKPLQKLEEFYMNGDTNVIDGNLEVLKFLKEKEALKKVVFTDRAHYSHTSKELGVVTSAYLENIFSKKKR